ncbi:hypothetical protein C3L33_12761, partial [Rhododendron williamsianum]
MFVGTVKNRTQNLANLVGLRPRCFSSKQAVAEDQDEDECSRPWRRRLSMAFNWTSFFKITLLILLVAAITTAFLTLPVDKVRFFLDFVEFVKPVDNLLTVLVFAYLVSHSNTHKSTPLPWSPRQSQRRSTKILKDFLLWVKQDLGPWGPFMLAVAYIPLTILAVPASILTVCIDPVL